MLSNGKTIAIGVGVAVLAFLGAYGIASASEKKPTTSATTAKKPDTKVDTKPSGTIDLVSVKGVQQGLTALGYSVGPEGVDDKFGPNTASGILKFNKDNGGPKSSAIDLNLRKLLAAKLRAKGLTVTGDTSTVVHNQNSEYGAIVSTGRLIGIGNIGIDSGVRNDVLARMNSSRTSIHAGKAIKAIGRKVGRKVGLVK